MTKNGTLIINNAEEFCNNIWQYKNVFTEEQWKEIINSFASNLQDIYNWLTCNEEFDMEDKLYVLGDTINMLNSIDVTTK